MKYFFSILSAVVLALMFISANSYLMEDSCLDSGKGVWDPVEKRCRQDCLKYGKDFGCISLLPDEINIIENCRHRQCLPDDKLKEICLRNHKAYNLEKAQCDFEFQFDDCGQKQGKWIYPDICMKK